jgi:DNA-binding transcriptional LysR family regulator
VIRSAFDDSFVGSSVRWRDLPSDRLIQLPPDNPIQRLIDRYLAKAGHRTPSDMVLNFIETQIAMAEAGGGIAIVPSFVLSACKQRNVVITPLVDPVVALDLFIIQSRGRRLPSAAELFTDFVKRSIGEWAKHNGHERSGSASSHPSTPALVNRPQQK